MTTTSSIPSLEDALVQAHFLAEGAKSEKASVEKELEANNPKWGLAKSALTSANAKLKACRAVFESAMTEIYRNTGHIPPSKYMLKPVIERTTTVTNQETVIEQLIMNHGIHAVKYLSLNRQVASDAVVVEHGGVLNVCETVTGDISWSSMR
ncbi:MAG: hypothetical protein SFZ02_21310 [bacterium]|nr:hypothetical protein [bacterium]